MDYNETMKQALAQARQLQQAMADAADAAAEQLKPQLQEGIKRAQALQTTLAEHAEDSTAIAALQTQKAVAHLNDFMRIGGEAMRESMQQMRAGAERMMEQSQKIVDATQQAARDAAERNR